MLSNNLNEILEKYDFTDSIIVNAKWADNLVDLIIKVDYYWNIQEGRNTARLLQIVFKNCLKVNFQMGKVFPLENNLVNTYSFLLFYCLRRIRIVN
jgi:hypothetical protein